MSNTPLGPQLENGHVKIANELFEILLKIKLFDYERRILFAIIRKTYGWNKKQDFISLSQLSKLTNIRIEHCARTLKTLKNKNIVFRKDGMTGINKHYAKWILPNQALPNQALPHQAIPTASLGNQPLPHQADTKDTITKDTIQKTKPSEASKTEASISVKKEKAKPSKAVEIYREIFYRYPKENCWILFDEKMSCENESTAKRWRAVCLAYLATGLRPNDYAKMFDWLENGIEDRDGYKWVRRRAELPELGSDL